MSLAAQCGLCLRASILRRESSAIQLDIDTASNASRPGLRYLCTASTRAGNKFFAMGATRSSIFPECLTKSGVITRLLLDRACFSSGHLSLADWPPHPFHSEVVARESDTSAATLPGEEYRPQGQDD